MANIFLAISNADRLYSLCEKEFYQRIETGEWSGWQRHLKKVAVNILWETAELHNLDPADTAKAASVFFVKSEKQRTDIQLETTIPL